MVLLPKGFELVTFETVDRRSQAKARMNNKTVHWIKGLTTDAFDFKKAARLKIIN